MILLSDREIAIGQEPPPSGRGCFDNQLAEGMVVLICRRLPANQKVILLCELCASSAAGGEIFMSSDGNYFMLSLVSIFSGMH